MKPMLDEYIRTPPRKELQVVALWNIKALRKQALNYVKFAPIHHQATCRDCEYLFRVFFRGVMIRKCALISLQYRNSSNDVSPDATCDAHKYREGPAKLVDLDAAKDQL